MTVVHLLDDVVLGNVGPSVLDANAGAHVVECAPIQLKELDEQHAKVTVGLRGILARVQLSNKQPDNNSQCFSWTVTVQHDH